MRLAVSFCVCTCHLVAGTIKLKLTVAIGSQGPYFVLWVLWCPAIPLASAGGRAVAELYGGVLLQNRSPGGHRTWSRTLYPVWQCLFRLLLCGGGDFCTGIVDCFPPFCIMFFPLLYILLSLLRPLGIRSIYYSHRCHMMYVAPERLPAIAERYLAVPPGLDW